VAATKLMMKTDVSPISGAASNCNSQVIADAIIVVFEEGEGRPL
jgi:hypothetical protein